MESKSGHHHFWFRSRKKHSYKGTTTPIRRRIRRKLLSIGGKAERRGPFLTELRNDIYHGEIGLDDERRKYLQHHMSSNIQQLWLNYNSQRVLAHVKGPSELEGVGKMFFVHIPSSNIGNFYVHENKLRSMIAE